MTEFTIDVVIPDRPTFKAAEVCELLKVQPYVLRSWENEFKDLGAARTPGGPRVYRRGDVERAFRIRHLVFDEGLTLAGVRRRLEQDKPQPEEEEAVETTRSVDPAARIRIERARQGLRGVLDLLDRAAPPSRAPARTTDGNPPQAGEVANTGAPAANAAISDTFDHHEDASSSNTVAGELFGLDTPAEPAAADAKLEAHSRKPGRRRKSASA